MTGLLASVKNPEEARQAAAGGADLIDFKDPVRGALGGLPGEVIARGVEAVAGRRPASATVGDPPMEPDQLMPAVREIAEAGVDLVKVGLDGPADLTRSVIDALVPAAEDGVALVAVLFADRSPDLGIIPALGAAGFRGVMLDTAGKGAGSLPAHMTQPELAEMVAEARKQELLTGLAGSLRVADIRDLLVLEPDFLGFRGALCGQEGREGILDPEALADVRSRIPASEGLLGKACADAEGAAAR
ncbi:(5-formylfuran-3-yl)methyl phosphate synthase [Thiohalorhabdus methylotrophus]|uniref:(5-formylfuran-3-yl)methyl phosphate synthase n=1 Tax=Thiohalorhabdus methylotrophus TaxID=3242694 RepID=A0ABV4TV38_9GAMM